MKEAVIFRVKSPSCEEDIKAIRKFEKRLLVLYKDTNQVPVVITDGIEVIKINELLNGGKR